MKTKKLFIQILLICIISQIKSWTVDSLWEFTMKNITQKSKHFLIDPDNLMDKKQSDFLATEIPSLYSNFGLNMFLFIIKKFDEKNINEKFLNDTIDKLENKIKTELLEKLDKAFISIVSVEDNKYKYKLGNEIKSRAYKRNLKDLKEVTEKYIEKKEYSLIFQYQLHEVEMIFEGNDDVLPWWDDEQAPIYVDPDSPDFDVDPPIVEPQDNVDKDKQKNKKKNNEKTGNAVFIVIIIGLCFLIAFLIWLFHSLAKRVKRMSVNNIDYNMFDNGGNQFKL